MVIDQAKPFGAADEGAGKRVRPLHIGLSIGHPRGLLGTLGGFVRSRVRPDRLGILSSSVVLRPTGARPGDYIHQPGPIDNRLFTGDSRIARLVERSTSDFAAANIECAYAELLPDVAIAGNFVSEAGSAHGSAPRLRVDARLPALCGGERVAKIGRGSGQTYGRVTAATIAELHLRIVEDGQDRLVTIPDVIEIEGESQPFSDVGDAGAVVYRTDDLCAVGLMFASVQREGHYRSFAHALAPALAALDLDWLD